MDSRPISLAANDGPVRRQRASILAVMLTGNGKLLQRDSQLLTCVGTRRAAKTRTISPDIGNSISAALSCETAARTAHDQEVVRPQQGSHSRISNCSGVAASHIAD
jgi:hypothetical protein